MSIFETTATGAKAARARIDGLIYETPLLPSRGVGEATGVNLFFKAENFQLTGSFKLRGASNKFALLGSGAQTITASSGNHGIACSHAAAQTGARLTVVLPENVSAAKLARIRRYGSHVIIHGEHSGIAEKHARDLSQIHAITYVSPYNDADIIAGQGTAGLEMLEQHPNLDAVFISLGGGGLVSGIGATLKAANPGIKVFGVSAEMSAALAAAIGAGQVMDVPHGETLADGVAGGMDRDSLTLPIATAVIDELLWCSEDEIRAGLRAYAEKEHQIVEGSAGLALAGFMQVSKQLRGKDVAVVTCGSNYDAARILPLFSKDQIHTP
jgi:threonine dehydratase